MNIHSLFSLVTAVVIFMGGTFIYYAQPKSLLHRLYFSLSASLALFAFFEFGLRQSADLNEAMFWSRIGISWSWHHAFGVHFTLLFTKKTKLLKHKWIYGLIYGPSIFFTLIEALGYGTNGIPKLTKWGWVFIFRDNWVQLPSLIYMISALLIFAILPLSSSRAFTTPNEKHSAKLLSLAGFIAFISVGIENGLPLFGVVVYPLSVPAIFMFALLVFFAVRKYQMFFLSPRTAADKILETMTDSLLLVDLKGNIIAANAASCRMLGRSEPELLGTKVASVFAPDADRPPWLTELASRRYGEEISVAQVETAYVNKNGDQIPVSLAGSLVFDENKQLQGYLLIARDITERRRTEKELDNYRDRLEELVLKRTEELSATIEALDRETKERDKSEKDNRALQEQLQQAQKMEAIGRLAGGVAHDFNNYLLIIRGYASSIHSDLHEDDRHRAAIGEIKEAANQATELTRQLLTFSRKQIIHPRVIDINQSIERILKLVSKLIGEDIAVSFEPNENLSKVKMDHVQVDQIVTNLVVNARDAMPNGGKVTIVTDNVDLQTSMVDGDLEVHSGRFVCISVKDTGLGMTEEMQKRIFEPFYTTKELGDGTGLGLATVYGIAKQNNGFIKVTSERNKGSQLKVFIPQYDPDQNSEDDEKPTSPLTGSDTILLVEDKKMVRRYIQSELAKHGYHVIEARDANEAEALFERNRKKIDLVLTDVVMPGRSGKVLAESLMQTHPDIKIIYMSGYNEEIIDKHGLLESDIVMIAKPFTTDKLIAKLHETLDS